MKVANISPSKLDEIIKREEKQRDSLPEHTLDWYTYSNRVTLLEEVKALIFEVPDPVEANKPKAPETQKIKEGEQPKNVNKASTQPHKHKLAVVKDEDEDIQDGKPTK